MHLDFDIGRPCTYANASGERSVASLSGLSVTALRAPQPSCSTSSPVSTEMGDHFASLFKPATRAIRPSVGAVRTGTKGE